MEDNRVGNKELLVIRSDKKCRQYMKECNMCQRIKNRTEISVGKLKLSEVLEKP